MIVIVPPEAIKFIIDNKNGTSTVVYTNGMKQVLTNKQAAPLASELNKKFKPLILR